MTRVVCCQLAPRLDELGANVARSTAAVRDAVGAGADVVVLPELVTSGYVFETVEEASAVAVSTDDALFDAWAAAAGDAVVVGGFAERGGDGQLYNSAAVVDRSGILAVYRKTHLWDREKLFFTPGDVLPPVVETRVGRIGVLICYDLEFPELTRAVALAGADLLVVPTNWPLMPRPQDERPGEVTIAMATARINHVAVACADRTGTERGQEWTEGTSVVDENGWVRDAVGAGEGTATADLDLAASRDKGLTALADAFADRRPELYGPVAGQTNGRGPR